MWKRFIEWLNKPSVPPREPVPRIGKSGYGRYKSRTYWDLFIYVQYLDRYAGTPSAQPTGPHWYWWWLKELKMAEHSTAFYINRPHQALAYIKKINYEDHGLVIPEKHLEEDNARIELHRR